MKYNEKYLLEAAQRFHDQAQWVVFTCSARYTVASFLIGFFAFALLAKFYPDQFSVPLLPSIAVAAVGLLVGVGVGTIRAFNLRVEAQKLMALVQIQRNTQSVKPEAVKPEAAVVVDK